MAWAEGLTRGLESKRRIVAGCAVHQRKQWRNANAPSDEKIFGGQFESKVVVRRTNGEQVADAEPSLNARCLRVG
jgi:hypothetical protein